MIRQADEQRRRRLPGLAALLGIAVLLWTTGAGAEPQAAPSGETRPGSEPEAITVAALPFRLATDEDRYAPLAAVLADLLMARLSAAEGLAFVERTAIEDVLREQELSALSEPAVRARVGRALGAQFVLTGSLARAGEEFRIDAHLLEVSTTRVARSAEFTARSNDLIEHVDKLARDLVGGLDLKLPPLTQEQIDRSPEANWHFARGLGYHYAGMHEHAATEFYEALAIDPGHAEARFSHAVNYFDQAEYGHARIEIARFLKQFSDHPLAPRARTMLGQCDAQLATADEGDTP